VRIFSLYISEDEREREEKEKKRNDLSREEMI